MIGIETPDCLEMRYILDNHLKITHFLMISHNRKKVKRYGYFCNNSHLRSREDCLLGRQNENCLTTIKTS
jgi:hypothetical protein